MLLHGVQPLLGILKVSLCRGEGGNWSANKKWDVTNDSTVATHLEEATNAIAEPLVIEVCLIKRVTILISYLTNVANQIIVESLNGRRKKACKLCAPGDNPLRRLVSELTCCSLDCLLDLDKV